MNIVIASDLHGSIKYTRMLFKKVDEYNAKKVLLLGDLYYNGARNLPPEEYSPRDMVELLNSYADRIIAVKGNCDTEVDQMVSNFVISENSTVFIFDKQITLTHGHHFNFDNLPVNPGDIFIQGHTHKSVLEYKDNTLLVNPGSVSIPKDGHHSYMVMNEEGIKLFDLLDDSLLKEIKF